MRKIIEASISPRPDLTKPLKQNRNDFSILVLIDLLPKFRASLNNISTFLVSIPALMGLLLSFEYLF
jgi:hypothetical protein